MTEQKDQGRYDGVADAAVSGIQALAPADKSWIAAVVLIVGMLTAADYFSDISNDAEVGLLIRSQTEAYNNILIGIEAHRAEEFRRAQESIRLLADALSRDSERAGRAALTAIGKGDGDK